MRESQEKNKDQVKNMRRTQKTKPHVVQREKIRWSGKTQAHPIKGTLRTLSSGWNREKQEGKNIWGRVIQSAAAHSEHKSLRINSFHWLLLYLWVTIRGEPSAAAVIDLRSQGLAGPKAIASTLKGALLQRSHMEALCLDQVRHFLTPSQTNTMSSITHSNIFRPLSHFLDPSRSSLAQLIIQHTLQILRRQRLWLQPPAKRGFGFSSLIKVTLGWNLHTFRKVTKTRQPWGCFN